MKLSPGSLAKGVGWTVGAYGFTQLARFATSMALTRILAPELFGIMLLVNSLRTGVDLVLDVGIGQNVIQNKFGEDPEFYNTAWTIQIIRGIFVWIVCCALSFPLAKIYDVQILTSVLPVAGLYFILTGFGSMGQFLLRRRLQFSRLNIFEMIIALISAVAQLILAYIYPTVWALVAGGLFSGLLTLIGSFFLVPNITYRLYVSKKHAWQIFTFGRWIFVSSIVYFLSINFDRLSLGKMIPLDVLGVYGIARSMSDLLVVLFVRLGDFIIFPLAANAANTSRVILRKKVAASRLRLLSFIAIGISVFGATADLIVRSLLDERYYAAGQILPVLVIGVWFSILCSINESTLLGFGKPQYGAVANIFKLFYLIVGLPLSFTHFGIVGAAAVIALADLCRYVPLLVGQVKERLSFGVQDTLLSLSLFALLAFWEYLRWHLDYGVSFQGLLDGIN